MKCQPLLGRVEWNWRMFIENSPVIHSSLFIRLRQNTLWLAAGMNGKVNRAVARRAKAGRLWRNSA
jgi:hypothetical protein